MSLYQNIKYKLIQVRALLFNVPSLFRRKQSARGFQEIRKQFYLNLWQETAQKQNAVVEKMSGGFLQISSGTKRTFVQNSDVMLDNQLIMKMTGNKPLFNKLLEEMNCPIVPFLEFDLNSMDEAIAFFTNSKTACVVKPAVSGAAGKGITTFIDSVAKLKRAAYFANWFSEKLLIEQQVKGASYRLLYLNGKLIDAIRRDSPTLTGDGKSTVSELVKRENRFRLHDSSVSAMHPISIDPEAKQMLSVQNLTLKSIPPQGLKFKIKHVVNQNSAKENFSVTNEVHPQIIKLGQKICQKFRIELAGIDLFSTNISLPLEETGGYIGEINTKPGLHHHYLISNKENGCDVSSEILNYIFTNSSIID